MGPWVPFAPKPKESDSAARPEAGLPEPDADGVRGWWDQHKLGYKPNGRYLDGQPHTPAVLCDALERGSMRRFGALAA